MVLLVGLFILCAVVAVTIARRKSRERVEEEDVAQGDLQALMEHDLQMLTAHPSLGDETGNDHEKHADDASLERSTKARNADSRRVIPLVFHDSDTEELFLLWDDADDLEPVVSVSPDADNPNVTRIYMNGDLVARVSCTHDIAVDDVGLMPQSAANSLGLLPIAA